MRFYEGIPTPGNVVNSELLYRIIKTSELKIIQYLTETITDDKLGLEVAKQVGGFLNAMNAEITTLFANTADVTPPVDTIYEDFRTKFANMEAINATK